MNGGVGRWEEGSVEGVLLRHLLPLIVCML